MSENTIKNVIRRVSLVNPVILVALAGLERRYSKSFVCSIASVVTVGDLRLECRQIIAIILLFCIQFDERLNPVMTERSILCLLIFDANKVNDRIFWFCV